MEVRNTSHSQRWAKKYLSGFISLSSRKALFKDTNLSCSSITCEYTAEKAHMAPMTMFLYRLRHPLLPLSPLEAPNEYDSADIMAMGNVDNVSSKEMCMRQKLFIFFIFWNKAYGNHPCRMNPWYTFSITLMGLIFRRPWRVFPRISWTKQFINLSDSSDLIRMTETIDLLVQPNSLKITNDHEVMSSLVLRGEK